MKKALIEQFHHPKGLLGNLAGWVMATRGSNLERNHWTVDLLDLSPGDRVMELGPGPGVTLGLILERVPDGTVVGVDHSATMLAQCKKANAKALAAKRLSLIQSSFTQLPALAGPFDKILAVNSLQFDALNKDTLAQIATHLKPDGVFAITFQPRGSNPTDAKALAFAKRVVGLLEDAGLGDTRIEQLPMKSVCAVCVLARTGPG
jgi:ubiquinone/menaquinone biosynthesis C-methylase UbiE